MVSQKHAPDPKADKLEINAVNAKFIPHSEISRHIKWAYPELTLKKMAIGAGAQMPLTYRLGR